MVQPVMHARGAVVQVSPDGHTPDLTSPSQVRVRAAVVPPECNFTFAYTDPKQDYDVSYHMETSGVVEAGITEVRDGPASWHSELFLSIARLGCQSVHARGKRAVCTWAAMPKSIDPRPRASPCRMQIAYKVLQGRCEVGAGRRNLFVDVGANFGWFAILAAKLGCRCGRATRK